MTRALAPQEVDKLTKILGLLGSAHDGERASAAAKADALVRAAGLTWADVINVPPIVPNAPRIRAWRSTNTDWQKMAAFCHARRDQLSSWERNFISAMLHWAGEPSEKQTDRLVSIYARMCSEAAA
jgi:hypothetical protein